MKASEQEQTGSDLHMTTCNNVKRISISPEVIISDECTNYS